LIGADDHLIGISRDFETRLTVGALRCLLIQAADRIAPGDFYHLNVRANDARVPSKTLEHDLRRLRSGCLSRDRIFEGLTEYLQSAQFNPATWKPGGESTDSVQARSEHA